MIRRFGFRPPQPDCIRPVRRSGRHGNAKDFAVRVRRYALKERT